MAAQWPPTFADSPSFPRLGFEIQYIGPKTLRTEFPDGQVYVREVSPTIHRRFTEGWELDRTDLKTLMQFYRDKGQVTKFSRRTFDPEDFANGQTTAIFLAPPTITQSNADRYRVITEQLETDI